MTDPASLSTRRPGGAYAPIPMKSITFPLAALLLGVAACSKNETAARGTDAGQWSDRRIELGPRQSLSVAVPGRDDLTMRVVRRGDHLVAFVTTDFEKMPDLERRRITFTAESDEEGGFESYRFSRVPDDNANSGLPRPSKGIVVRDVDGDGLPDYRSDATGVYRAASIRWERVDTGGTIPEVPVEVMQSISGPSAR